MKLATVSLLSFLLGCDGLSAGEPAVLDGVKVSLGLVTKWMSGGQGGPGVQVKLSSPELVNAKGIRALLKEAKDDAGNVLSENKPMFAGFVPLRPSQPGFQTGLQPGELQNTFALIATGKPKAIKQLTGTVEVLLPTKDPGSVITASFAKDAGVPLQDAALKAAGVEITLLKPSDAPTHNSTINGVPVQYWKLAYTIKDPQGKVFAGECLDAPDGKVIAERPQWQFENLSHIAKTKEEYFSLTVKPTAEFVLKFYLITDKSVLAVPIDLKDIAVP